MIELSKEGDVAIIKMDDGKVNAANEAFLHSLNASLDEADASSKAVIIAGRPGAFSAGFDLKIMQGDDKAARDRMTDIGSRTVSRIFSSKIPVVAAVTGHAFALGAVLNSACDYSIGAKGPFKFAVNETSIGEAFPPWGYEVLLSRLSKSHVYAAGVLSMVLDVEAALKANFIHEAAEADDVLPRAIAVATELAKLPKEAYWANKSVFRGEALARVADSIGAF